jgi:hypothetical protein
MPTGPPDFSSQPGEQESTADRIIRQAMEAGEFDDLPGLGKPIPGAGNVDDDLWWVRSWMERTRDSDGQAPNNRE